MALTTGQLVSGAGYVSQGMRTAEEAERQARQNQLKIEAQNRANEERKRMAQFQAGLQVPDMPQFPGMTGGQQQVQSLAVPVPAAPAPTATAYPVNMNAPEAKVVPVPSDMDTGGFPLGGEPPAATPLGRGFQQIAGGFSEAAETQKLRDQIMTRYGIRAGIPGLIMPQTAEERQFAKDVMDRVDYLSPQEMQQLLQTGKLPEAKPAAAGVVEPTKQQQQPTGKQPAASMDGGVFYRAAQERNLPTDVTTLNKIVGLVNRGYTPEQAADNVARTYSYDNRQTPYDPLITQAAQQYGLDPVIFKRLIGTESSFDPNAVSPRGEKFGLGIGQIAEVHGLSREQRLDPNVSIPKAAEIFAGYLRQAGGDYNEAIMRYKGASSEKGRAAMQGPADVILNGTGFELAGKNPTQTADNVAAAASAPTPAASGVMYGPSEVPGGMQNPGVQSAMMLRQMMAEQYRIASEVGNPESAMQALTQITAIDLGLFKAQGDLGAQELITTGDASRAMSVLSQFTGTPTQALARGDGAYDIYRNGRLSQTAVPVGDLADLIRTSIDAEYRTQKTELAAKRSMVELEQGFELKKITLNKLGDLQKALVEGNYELLLEEAKKEGKVTVDSTNGVVLYREEGRTFVVTPNEIQEVGGVEQRGPVARPINIPR
jgi:soluble lytic murein transglycosylase-like protein